MIVSMIKSHGCFVKCIFYIEDAIISREIIIKNASGSNDNIFFSIIYRYKSLVLLGFREAVVDDKGIFGIYWTDFEIGFDRKIVRENEDSIISNFLLY